MVELTSSNLGVGSKRIRKGSFIYAFYEKEQKTWHLA
jgi:hypothetical protein